MLEGGVCLGLGPHLVILRAFSFSVWDVGDAGHQTQVGFLFFGFFACVKESALPSTLSFGPISFHFKAESVVVT